MTKIQGRRALCAQLLYGNLGASLSGAGQVLNALVDDSANCFEEFDARIGKMRPNSWRYAKTFLYSV